MCCSFVEKKKRAKMIHLHTHTHIQPHSLTYLVSTYIQVHDQYPHLLAEMFAYCLAAAHLRLAHQTALSFMVSDTGSGGEVRFFVCLPMPNDMIRVQPSYIHIYICSPPPTAAGMALCRQTKRWWSVFTQIDWRRPQCNTFLSTIRSWSLLFWQTPFTQRFFNVRITAIAWLPDRCHRLRSYWLARRFDQATQSNTEKTKSFHGVSFNIHRQRCGYLLQEKSL